MSSIALFYWGVGCPDLMMLIQQLLCADSVFITSIHWTRINYVEWLWQRNSIIINFVLIWILILLLDVEGVLSVAHQVNTLNFLLTLLILGHRHISWTCDGVWHLIIRFNFLKVFINVHVAKFVWLYHIPPLREDHHWIVMDLGLLLLYPWPLSITILDRRLTLKLEVWVLIARNL